MATRTISNTWAVEGVLTNVTTAKLSDPTGTYGVKRNDTDAMVVADGTAMTIAATGVYEYSFTDVEDVAYTAYVEIVYGGATYHFEVDLAAPASTGAMTSSYSSLLERVGHFLFGIRSAFSSDQTTDIEECIKDGLHRVYAAHNWSFFRPIKRTTTTEPYATGTITVASGVVKASALIEAEFDPQPVITNPVQARQEGVPQTHEKGNLLKHIKVRKGDMQKGFAESDIVLEHTFHTQSTDHAFLEPDCSIAVPQVTVTSETTSSIIFIRK